MGQRRISQNGTFHITTNAANRLPWCTWLGVPEIIIDNLAMTRNLQIALVHAFCILPNHMHIILSPGEQGLSKFMHSFKKNSMRDICTYLGKYYKSRGVDFRIDAAADNDPRRTNDDLIDAAADNDPRCTNDDLIDAAADNDPRRTSDSKIAGIRWHKGFHDEKLRDGKQITTAMNYVHFNAVRHRLVDDVDSWPWTSLHFQNVIDTIPMEAFISSPFDFF